MRHTLFLFLPLCKRLWSQIQNIIKELLDLDIVLEFDQMMSVVKQFLYRWQCQKVKPNIEMIKIEIDFVKQIELSEALRKTRCGNITKGGMKM